MKKGYETELGGAELREKAEDMLKGRPRIKADGMAVPDLEKLIHELEVRQSELEILNEDLRQSRDAAAADVKKYTIFYDFATVGCFTLDSDSTIRELNLNGARLLGMERKDLINSRFNSFISAETVPAFDEFLRDLFKSGSRQTCEVRLKNEDDISAFIYIEGMVFDNGQKCHMTVLDITDRKLAEQTVYNLLSEKEIILKEVHHRVKNNMYNIGALLNMQANVQDDPAAKSVLFDAAGRVQSMSVLYDKLYRSEYKTAVSLKEYFPDLIYEIVGIFPNKKSVKVKTEVDDIVLEAKILSILGILVNELVTNSMKYAFEGRSDGLIAVTVSKSGSRITITIADNGKGIPENITFQNSTGFGMQLVSMLTEQLGGVIDIKRGNGTKFILEFDS